MNDDELMVMMIFFRNRMEYLNASLTSFVG